MADWAIDGAINTLPHSLTSCTLPSLLLRTWGWQTGQSTAQSMCSERPFKWRPTTPKRLATSAMPCLHRQATGLARQSGAGGGKWLNGSMVEFK